MSDTVSPLAALVAEAHEAHTRDLDASRRRLQQGFELLPAHTGDAVLFARELKHQWLAHRTDVGGLAQAWARLQPLAGADPALAALLAQGHLAMALIENPDALQRSSLPAADRVRACGDAAQALAQQADWGGARGLFEAADALAGDGGDAAVMKAFAALSNNLASDILDTLTAATAGDAPRVGLMLHAARRARDAWALAGGWLQVERADYLLALCHAKADQGAQAIAHAQACLDACQQHDADAFERLFAHEALALAMVSAGRLEEAARHRAQMGTCFQDIGEDLRRWAEPALAKVDAALQ